MHADISKFIVNKNDLQKLFGTLLIEGGSPDWFSKHEFTSYFEFRIFKKLIHREKISINRITLFVINLSRIENHSISFRFRHYEKLNDFSFYAGSNPAVICWRWRWYEGWKYYGWAPNALPSFVEFSLKDAKHRKMPKHFKGITWPQASFENFSKAF
jgi:hypothetical protein